MAAVTKLVPVPREAVASELLRIADVLRADEFWDDDCERRLAEVDVLATPELVYVAYTYVGSVGTVLVRKTGVVHQLASAISLDTQLWAVERGFNFDFHGVNTLRIRAVHDRDATIEVFKRGISAEYARAELAPKLESTPFDVVLGYNEWFYSLQDLRDTTAFEFEVNP
jgi:hypothetical protein